MVLPLLKLDPSLMLEPDAIFTIRVTPRKLRRRCKGTNADGFEDETQPKNTVSFRILVFGAIDVYVYTMLNIRSKMEKNTF